MQKRDNNASAKHQRLRCRVVENYNMDAEGCASHPRPFDSFFAG